MASKKDWDAAVKTAEKTLGDKAKIPKWPAAIDKAHSADNKNFAEFDKVRQQLKQKLVASQNSTEATKNAISQLEDEVEECDLGLDSKNKDAMIAKLFQPGTAQRRD